MLCFVSAETRERRGGWGHEGEGDGEGEEGEEGDEDSPPAAGDTEGEGLRMSVAEQKEARGQWVQSINGSIEI